MKVASLEAYGAHADLLAAWTQQYNAELLPIQEKAVLEGNVLNGTSVVGSGPTGCGKTFIAEMAATHAAGQGRRAFYLTPTKALAEAVYARFERLYGALGLRVAISTQDRRGADRRISRGEFDIAVTVPEKLWTIILASPALASSVGALVVDELQMLGDPDRGPCLELLLARFLATGTAQLVGLSAVLSNGHDLARWLGARLIEEHRRPVELRKGVWREGRFSYFEHNSRTPGEEDIADGDWEESGSFETMVGLAAVLAERGEPTLAFVRDRMSTVRAATLAAGRFDGRPAEGALERIRELPRTQATACLADLLQSGVAFHNADLHLSERRIVEDAFASGEVVCLFSTSTLAVGLNLPARNVLVEPLKWRAGLDGNPSLSPLGQAEFEGMAGRAGRLGFGDPFGRAILVGTGGFDADSLMRRYVLAGPEPIEGQFGKLPELQRLMLTTALLSAGPAGAPAPPLFSRLPDGADIPAVSPGSRALPDDLAAMAEGAGLVTRSDFDGGLTLTGVGRAAAASGLSISTLGSMTRTISHLGRAPTNLEALILAALSAEARAVPLPRAREDRRWIALLEERSHATAGWTDCARGILWSGPLRAGERETAARIAMLALEWGSRETTADLESRTGVHAGRALALCETVGWLVQCLARLAEELACDPGDVERLQGFGEAIAAGLPEDCLALHRLHLAAAQRDHVLALSGAGVHSRADLAGASESDLARLLPPAVVREARRAVGVEAASPPLGGAAYEHGCEAARRESGPAVPPSVGTRLVASDRCSASEAPEPEPAPAVAPPAPEHNIVLVVDAGRPDIAIVNGHDISLRPMEFQLLAVLARQPRRCVSFDRLYDELWGSKDAVEPQQIYWHRHNLSKKLMRGMPEGAAELVRTIPRRGLMFDLPADQAECVFDSE